MEGILDTIISDDDFAAQSTSQAAGESGGDPVEEAFSYPKMEEELGLKKK